MEDFIIKCPNCNEFTMIQQINCGIFRHGIIKKTGQQIDPHLNKELCEQLINNNEIYGCGKPFQIIINNNKIEINICDYI
jgi:hypothetical protein